jgi:alpha-glucosidase
LTGPEAVPWWETAVVYQIYPRSFCDASGDGVGDLDGICGHLDHLSWLGVDAIWLSPFYRSPMADFGYDVSDHCDVDPLFGDLDTFDRLVALAHERGLKVIVDFVPNHTSDRHPWFEESRSSRDNPKRDWYFWRDGRTDAEGGSGPPGSNGRLPNNWRAAFPGVGGREFPPAWTWDERTGQFYLHLFLAEQPDLDWGNPAVRSAMDGVLRFWLARGVDGFRVDVIHGIGKDPSLPDLPPGLAPIPAIALADDPSAHPLIASMRSLVDSWPDPPPRMLVGEVVLPTSGHTLAYYGSRDAPELNLVFNFHPLRSPWQAEPWRRHVQEVEEMLGPRGWWPTWVLSNHDNPRHRTRYGSEARARAAAVLLLTLRGTPFLYAGEELGLEDADVPLHLAVDPGGRDGCRAPIPWDPAPAHGWAGGPKAWLPWPPGAGAGMNVAEQLADSSSMLHLYRRILDARRTSPALRHGSFRWLESPDGTLAYAREADGDERVVVVNFSGRPATVDTGGGRWPRAGWEVQLSTSGSAGRSARTLQLGADEAAVLRPGAGGHRVS